MISNVRTGGATPTRSKASVTPEQFAESHSTMLQDTLGPVAKNAGARALSGKLRDVIREESRNNPDLAMLADNLSDVSESRKGSIPLKEVYQVNRQLVQEAAEQAARSSGGVLNSESARFLPEQLRADYEHLTGQSISDKPGVAVDGVQVKGEGRNVQVDINFEKALAGATAKDVVLAVTDTLTLKASRLEGVEDPNLPPYWVVISPRQGKLESGAQINSGSGYSSFSNPDSGHLIRAGHTDVNLYTDYNDKKPFQTIAFNLDKVNDYGTVAKEPSAKTEGVRGSWEALCEASGGEFNFEDGIKAGKLESRSLDEVRELPGVKTLFKAIRENSGQAISKLVKNGLLEFAVEKDTNSLGVLRRVDGESEHWMSVVDLNKGRWVGTWSVGDDGTREWNER